MNQIEDQETFIKVFLEIDEVFEKNKYTIIDKASFHFIEYASCAAKLGMKYDEFIEVLEDLKKLFLEFKGKK